MRKVLIPVLNRNFNERDFSALISALKKAKCDMAMLIFPRVLRSEKCLSDEFNLFLRTKERLIKEGIEVGAWMAPSIGHGGTGAPGSKDNDAPSCYERITFADGTKVFAYCPTDEAFRKDFINTVKTICETGVKLILFEDDFTLSGGKVLAGKACICPRHKALLKEAAGIEYTKEILDTYITGGKENRYRNIFDDVMGKTLKEFASEIEREVHKDYPNVRIGLSANSASYLMEGVDILELCKIIAGENEPFLRLTGAPYWQNAGSLNASIEAIKLQSFWANGMECVSEGDGLPRQRQIVSASEMEIYDMASYANNPEIGILKYMLDYSASADYEKGYVDLHSRNEKHYEEIKKRFSGKRSVGLNVAEFMDMYKKTTIGEDFSFALYGSRNYLPAMSQWMIVDNSIPTTYGCSDSASIAFGENVLNLSEKMLKNGVITDAVGAKCLIEKGIDVGISSYTKLELNPVAEYFCKEDQYTAASFERRGVFYDFSLKEGAEVLSSFVRGSSVLGTSHDDFDKQEKFPSAIYYENEKGYKFMIYSFVPITVYTVNGWHPGLFRNYFRQKQLANCIEKMQGRKLPAMLFGAPGLYTVCKKDEKEMSVALFNISKDTVFDGEIVLDKAYKNIDCYNIKAELSGNKIILKEDISPYNFAFITLEE